MLWFSIQNKGVQKLLDAIIEYMPAPTDIPAITGVDGRQRSNKTFIR